jgi:hypothetical protein
MRHEKDQNLKHFPDDYHEYPVDVHAIRCDWMFADQNTSMQNSGMQFLYEIYQTESFEYYDIPAI